MAPQRGIHIKRRAVGKMDAVTQDLVGAYIVRVVMRIAGVQRASLTVIDTIPAPGP